ncbi:MAG: efflux RND transporter permease subunit [Verrucomicrobia bacterium]|nr:efflux RND transporter permease subunit [Verrucomicrobiota bacterium]
MSPAKTTITNNRTALVIYVGLLLAGISSYLQIGRMEYPDFTIRNANIVTNFDGRSTLEVEQQISDPIERELRQMPEIKKITSTSKPGLSILSVELEDTYFDLEPIWQDMRNKVADVELPDGARTPTINDDVGDVFPYVYALTSDGFSYKEMLDYADYFRDEIMTVDGVGKVEFHGDVEERIYLEFSSSQVAARGFSPSQISQAIAAQNAVASSGTVLSGNERLSLVTKGEFQSLEELADYRLALPDTSTTVRVSDVVKVKRGYQDPPRLLSHFNGSPVISVAISMSKGEAVTEVGERIETKIHAIQTQLPIGLEIERMFYQPIYVSKSIRDFIINLGQAFTFVVVVMFLFAGLRIALIVGILVPSAILITFVFMPMFGVQLEMMSIAALIIALGLLVDNAVVVSEQILVRKSKGESPLKAVVESVDGLVFPLLAASGTTIAAFSTIALSEGTTSEFTYSLFAVISLTLLASWVLSITIIPLFCYYFLKPLKRDTFVGRALNKLYSPYERLLRTIIRLRWAYPILILALTFIAVLGMRFVPTIFFPPNERGQFVIDCELPLGTDILETERTMLQLERWLLDENETVASVSSWIGGGGPRWYLSLSPETNNPNYGFLSVLTHTSNPEEIRKLIEDTRLYALDNLLDARVTPKALESGPPVGDPIQIRLYGTDLDTIYELRERIVGRLNEVEGLYDIRDNWGAWTKQVTIDPDPVRAARLGLNTQIIAQALEIQFSGQTISHYLEENKSIPVVLRSQEDYRDRPERLIDLPIYGSSSGFVPLSQVAKVAVTFQPGSILRENLLRVMTIKGKASGRFASELLADIQPKLSEELEKDDWPTGYYIEYGGEQEESAESQKNLAAAMPFSLSLLGLILIAQFNSLRRFLIIILTIPPMMIGVVPGLILTGSSFGFMTILGLIALMGIIVNNAILLIDGINIQLKNNPVLIEAIVAAAVSRMRPIILTTCTTIIGLLPLAISGGGMWSSMAYAMMFGLAFATALTLLLCPSLFYLFFRKTYSEKQDRPTS